jgi:hypothetical protein
MPCVSVPVHKPVARIPWIPGQCPCHNPSPFLSQKLAPRNSVLFVGFWERGMGGIWNGMVEREARKFFWKSNWYYLGWPLKSGSLFLCVVLPGTGNLSIISCISRLCGSRATRALPGFAHGWLRRCLFIDSKNLDFIIWSYTSRIFFQQIHLINGR